MPVVVTAAETPLGRLVVARLRADGAEVRAVVESPADDLGVPTSLTDWRDAERLGAVLEGAHTVIHLAGDRRVADLLAAAEDSGVRRIVVVARGRVQGLEGTPYEVIVVPDTRRRLSRAVDPVLVDVLVEADRKR